MFPGRLKCQLGLSLEDETNEWAVDRIVNHYGRRSTALFEILWKSGDRSWMPHDQAKRLQELPEYQETLGVSDVKDLPYGTGKPAENGEEIHLGSISYFWAWRADAFKQGNIAEVTTTVPTFTSVAMLHSDIFSNPILSNPAVSERYTAFNAQHHMAKHLLPGLFRMDVPGIDTVLISSHTMRLYADYNVALCGRNQFPDLVPAYYNDFANNMNTHDKSGVYWATVDNTTQTIVWDDAWTTAADPRNFGILEHELSDRFLLQGKVAVTQEWYENSERLAQMERDRQAAHG
ncbi:hypothetical protein B0H17DRAFT_589372 [Mycena rosella]|uniref:Uncharacterized protein n=1 Tax=Mycena rosella TaxID=1033263 RepID=A0AAD7DHR6_MYCRO|nr:hypothetical protein B0H17DRAFT_589372 [Mycena rosella]